MIAFAFAALLAVVPSDKGIEGGKPARRVVEAGIEKFVAGRTPEEARSAGEAAYGRPVTDEIVYVNGSMTLDELNRRELKPGTKVLFERGRTWRGQIVAQSGKPGHPIVYGAYGEGPKPCIQPSYDGSDASKWRPVGEGLWRIDVGAGNDIGNIVLSRGGADAPNACGFKRQTLAELRNDLDFCCEKGSWAVTMRSAVNPAARFGSVELCEKIHCVDETWAHDVVYEGLHLRYSAAHGIGGSDTKRITVRGCDISWIGGGYLYYDKKGNGVRYGNGIEFWSAAEGHVVESNRVWECWDAGLTNQSSEDGVLQDDIVWRGNEVWNCEYSFEYWQQGAGARTRNVRFVDNVCRDAGKGWGHRQRWNPNAAHLMFYDTTADTQGFVVRGNSFVRSEKCLIRLFNDWRRSLTLADNAWVSAGEPICRYHGRPTKDLVYKYPDRLDQLHDDNLAEIQSQGTGARVFGAGELEVFLGFMGCGALDRFWDGTSGETLRRMPLGVVPENVFWSLSNASFEEGEAYERTAAADIAAKSVYNVVTLTLRSIPDLSDRVTERFAETFIRESHANGVKVLMDIDARIARREFLRRWPEDHAGVLRLVSAAPKDGVARFSADFGHYRDHMAWGAERAYDPSNGRVVRALAAKADASGEVDWGTVRDLTASVRELSVVSNRVSGAVAGLAADERLFAAVGFDLFAVDPCTDRLTPYLKELALRYRALGADGAMRDEWGFPPMRDYVREHSAVPFTGRFAAAYSAARGGRDYVADMLLAFAPAKGMLAERRAAVDALNMTVYETIALTEREFYALNKELFGPDVYVTKHPTWHTRFCDSEFLHNGFDWWAAPRDWAQSDEGVPIPCICGMAKKFGGPCWMNEGYGPNPSHYGSAVWKYALCGGRMVYHGIYGGESSIKKLNLPPAEAKRRAALDILTPENVRAQARVCLLNLITRAQIDCPTALVFGHRRVMNWLDPAFEDGGLALAHALADTGRFVDEYPSTEIAAGTLALDADGYLRVGQQRYTALVLHRLDGDDAAAFGRLIAGRAVKTALFSYDSPEMDGVRGLASGTDAAPVVAALDAAGATRQTPLTAKGLHAYGNDHLPGTDGTLRLLDGTVARIKGCTPCFAGDPISGTLSVGAEDVGYEAEGGLFAVRLDAAGKVEALAAGGLRRVEAPGLSLRLDRGEDVALVRRNGRWQGLWQTAVPSASVPPALKALTDDWRILRLP